MFLALFGSTQSASFQCQYSTNSWGYFSTIYRCDVQNAVNITTLDAAQVDSITGTHLPGYIHDNVEAFSVYQGQIHYFPRGLNQFFTNLKGILIYNTGLKEIHQSDLKDFPKLTSLYLYRNNLEILEDHLFEFNPDLEEIYLYFNKITHIDSNVFAKLTKLKTLYLNSNTCINMGASNNPTVLQNVITTARAQCINSEYSNLELKLKNLEIDSKNLNSENLKLKLYNLENEIKISKFPNFFQERLQALKALVIEKETTTTTIAPNDSEICISKTCSALETKVNNINDKLVGQDLKISRIEEKMTKISDAIDLINKNYEDMNKRLKNLINSLDNAFSANN